MSVVSGCIKGAEATGLVTPNKRADAYSELTEEINKILGGELNIPRKDAKQCLMTSLYGSKATPKRILGENTPELKAFYQALQVMCPGAYELLGILLESWDKTTKCHSWKMPDGFDVRVKVFNKKKTTIEVQELGNYKCTYEYKENEPLEFGLSNAANVTHSIDGYVLRTLHRKCNYDKEMVLNAKSILEGTISNKNRITIKPILETKVGYYIEQYARSSVCDITILPYLVDNPMDVEQLDNEHIEKLLTIIDSMLEYEPFELVTIHDEFKAHPNNLNYLRQQYINTLVELAQSNLLQDLLRQLYKQPKLQYIKQSENLAEYIKNSNYGIC